MLTVSGKVTRPNAGAVAQFDMPMLEALAQQDITTNTPWYSGPRTFTGPLLRDVLALAGAKGASLRAVALNDYEVSIPFEDVDRHDLVLARLLDGKPMPVRDKGPLFLIYPFDRKPELRVAQYFERCAWQLKTIEVR